MFDLASGSPASSGLTASDITAIFAATIAAVAVGLAAWEGWQNRKHARLSVRPHLVCTVNLRPGEAGLMITNQGLGPAVLREISFSFKGKSYVWDSNHYETFMDFRPHAGEWATRTLRQGAPIRSGEVITLLQQIALDDDTDEDNEACLRFVRRIGVSFSYESFYQEEFEDKEPPVDPE